MSVLAMLLVVSMSMLSDEICASIENVASCQHCQYCQMRSVSVLAMLSDELSASIGNVVRGYMCQHRASVMLSDEMCFSIGNVASLPVVWTSFGQCMAGMVWQHCISWVPACTAVVTRVLFVNN